MLVNTLYELDYKEQMAESEKLLVRWREKEGSQWVRKQKVIEDFQPYCYVPTNSQLWVSAKDGQATYVSTSDLPEHKSASWMIDRLEKTDKVSSEGVKLTKVYVRKPWMLNPFRTRVKPSFEADVPYEDRFLIDRVQEMNNFEMRKLFIDLEALQFREVNPSLRCNNPRNSRDHQEINVIGVYDSFTGRRTQWCQHPTFEIRTEMRKFDGEDVLIHYFRSERQLLEEFVGFVDATDPDCLVAWGMSFYDLPTLYFRLESNGIGADRLSPSSLGKNRWVVPPRHKGNQYKEKAQPVVGRLTINLDKIFSRVYKDSTSIDVPGNSLDVVGERLFGRGKTEFKPDFYDDEYQNWIDDYLYYNFRDVELMKEIDDKYNLVSGQQNLQELAMCQYNATFSASSYARVYFMRMANFIQKTGWMDGMEGTYKGAIIMDPEEKNTIGLHKNVAILDFAGLYPSCMIAANCSWETKLTKDDEWRDDDIIGDGCRFRRSPEGVLPKCVKELDVLRDEYKAKRSEASKTLGKNSEEYKKWDTAQKTVKRMRASFYGLLGYIKDGYAWADLDIAKTITMFGRNALLRIEKETNELGFEVIYGHTDSIFVKLGDDKNAEECAIAAREIAKICTEVCQDEFKTDALVVEAEAIMDRFYLPRRNKYAGRVIWMPGTGKTPFDIANEPVDKRIIIKGLEAKHAKEAKIAKTVQLEAMKMIWDDKNADEVLDYVKDLISKVRNGEVDISEMVSGKRLGQWLPQTDDHYSAAATNLEARPDARDLNDKSYTNLSGEKKGAAWHNIVLANEDYPKMDKGDVFSYIYAKDGPTWIPDGGWIAFHEISQISEYEIDIEKIIEKLIISKLDHIFYGIGLDNDILRERSPYKGKILSMEDFQ